MEKPGGKLVAEILDETRDEVREYFGAMNEVRLGARSKVPPKPDKLRVYEAVKESGLPILAGGFMDQPYIWMDIFEVISQEKMLQEMLEAASNKQRQ